MTIQSAAFQSGLRRLAPDQFVEGILSGNRPVLSRFITLLESRLVEDRRLAQHGEHKNPGASSPTELKKTFGSLVRDDTIGLRCRAPRRYAFTSSRWFCEALAQ
jgi:hypothetical protein